MRDARKTLCRELLPRRAVCRLRQRRPAVRARWPAVFTARSRTRSRTSGRTSLPPAAFHSAIKRLILRRRSICARALSVQSRSRSTRSRTEASTSAISSLKALILRRISLILLSMAC
nr:hypothetical protein BDOA9_0128050 [Bradyrhizobium sp. DOA9]